MKMRTTFAAGFAALGICVALFGCGSSGGGGDPERMSATQQCGLLSNAYGPFFFCGTNQANLNVGGFQDGSTGYCMPTQQNLGTVGYSAVTNRGGAFPVGTQAEASANCSLLANNPFPDNCTTYIRCTRICAAGVSNCTGTFQSESEPLGLAAADWPAQAVPAAAGVFGVLAVAMNDDRKAILSARATMDAFRRPVRGDQAAARQKNSAGLNALKEGSLDMAIELLKAGIEADSGDAELSSNLGRALMLSGRLDEAKAALIGSLTLDSERAPAWLDLGLVFARQGDPDLAAAAFITSGAVSRSGLDTVNRFVSLSQSAADRGVQEAAARALGSRVLRDSAAARAR